MDAVRPHIEPFFLPATVGERFCLLHRPAPGVRPRGGVLYVHPFAEEMHKSRRMAALQARAFAASGYAVLQVDLFGCGDSSGELGAASIQLWRNDISMAAQWMQARGLMPLRLWGLRLGALLAADWVSQASVACEGLILWQPVASGETHLTQFLRVGIAADLFATRASEGGKRPPRARLAAGEIVEIAGYSITPTLARDMDALRLSNGYRVETPVDWFEICSDGEGDFSPASQRIVDQWQAAGASVSCHSIAGDPFWTTTEISIAPALIDATTATRQPCTTNSMNRL